MKLQGEIKVVFFPQRFDELTGEREQKLETNETEKIEYNVNFLYN